MLSFINWSNWTQISQIKVLFLLWISFPGNSNRWLVVLSKKDLSAIEIRNNQNYFIFWLRVNKCVCLISQRIEAVVDKFIQELKEALDADIKDRIMKESEMWSYIEELKWGFWALSSLDSWDLLLWGRNFLARSQI